MQKPSKQRVFGIPGGITQHLFFTGFSRVNPAFAGFCASGYSLPTPTRPPLHFFECCHCLTFGGNKPSANMAVRFKLRTPNGDKETAIFLIYYYDGKKFQQATGRRILPKFWNTDIESGRVLLNRIIKDAAKIAGIDSPTRQTYKSRGESLEKTKMKSRMVSTKICRKTFVSNFRQTGIPTDLLLSLIHISEPTRPY